MKLRIIFLAVFQVYAALISAQATIPPPVKNHFKTLTSYDELSWYIHQLEKESGLLKIEVIGQTVKGRNIYGMMFSSSHFSNDKSKIKVFIFAQQHGNEQSGKEGALLLARELLKPENRYLFDKIDLVLVPQVNPDGSEINTRRNANGVDLNRNHLILTEPETIALHQIFDKYLFEVTIDIHEYSPFGEEWKKYGYRKNSDITVGATTNLNVSENIRNLSNNGYLPFIFHYLNTRNFSSFTYCPGGPPGVAYFRHSTFDINDGRQSFGIQNTFSFIQEGMNGKDDSIENLQHRAEGQMTGMRGLLEYVFLHKDKIKNLVVAERKKIISGSSDQEISVQSEHIGNGQKLPISLFSYFSGKDSIINVKDYRPFVKSLYDVKKPVGYLIPKEVPALVEWAVRESLNQIPFTQSPENKIEQYFVTGIDSIDFEGDIIVNPQVALLEFQETISDTGYIFITTAQLKGNMLVLALEPKSMLGLSTYEKFSFLLKSGQPYPVLRVMKK